MYIQGASIRGQLPPATSARGKIEQSVKKQRSMTLGVGLLYVYVRTYTAQINAKNKIRKNKTQTFKNKIKKNDGKKNEQN